MLKGSVDSLTTEGATGWIYGPSYFEHPRIGAFLDRTIIGDTIADAYRPDLERVGFGDGKCGFVIQFREPIDAALVPFVRVRPENVDLCLPLNGGVGFVDLVTGLLADYRGAGRHRSILGGLWTDRTDAAQVLAGRLSVGSCPPDIQSLLLELIANGFVVLEGLLAPLGFSAADLESIGALPSLAAGEGIVGLRSTLSSVGNLLFREEAVRLFRAVLDDQPVVYGIENMRSSARFGQMCSAELLPSPTECLGIYVGHPEGKVRLDYIRDSHELAELSARGVSRWTPEGARDLTDLAGAAGLSIQSVEVGRFDVVVVGPGLVHRIVTEGAATALRAVCTPRRVTPARFLTGDGAWSEVGHVSGARIRY